MQEITLGQARVAINAAIEKAIHSNVRVSIAVVDAGANLKACARMDDADLASVEHAIAKAKAACRLLRSTAELGDMAQVGESLEGPPDLAEAVREAGGVLLYDPDGLVVGALGVAGGMAEDHQVAETGAREIAAVRALV